MKSLQNVHGKVHYEKLHKDLKIICAKVNLSPNFIFMNFLKSVCISKITKIFQTLEFWKYKTVHKNLDCFQ